jgi:NAD(P)-dependent dehydrogenase (short-subunit alcohol dehydrogenase family)
VRATEGLDGFVPCAGLAGHVPDRALVASLNFFGSTVLVEGLKDLLVLRKGAVVLISSNSAPMPTDDGFVAALLEGDEAKAREIAQRIEGQPVYGGSKRALAFWMRRVAPGYARDGVRMNAIAPGYTQTPMTAAVEKDPVYGEAIRQFMASIPVGRPGQPDDIADAAEFLLSPKAAFICGSVLFVDGGHDAMLRSDVI